MRGGYPVHVSHIQQYKFPEGFKPRRISDVEKHGTLVEEYWQVRGGVAGDCGHKHATREEAEQCLEPMRKKWFEWRSAKSKEIHAKRRSLKAACNSLSTTMPVITPVSFVWLRDYERH